MGINRIGRNTLPQFIQALKECDDQDYFERGVEILIERGEKFKPLNIGERFCVEVDFPEDLKEAKRYFRETHR